MSEEKPRGILSKLKRSIKDQDILAPTIATEMTFGKDFRQNTYIGGIASIVMYGYMVYIVISQGLAMVNKKEPYILTTHEPFDFQGDMADEKLYLKDLNTVIFHFRDHRWISFKMQEIE